MFFALVRRHFSFGADVATSLWLDNDLQTLVDVSCQMPTFTQV